MNPKKALAVKKDPVKKIFVGSLNPEATEEKIREYFCKFGEIEAIEFSLDPESTCLWRPSPWVSGDPSRVTSLRNVSIESIQADPSLECERS